MADRPHGSYKRYKLGPDANDQPGKGCRCYPCSWAQAQCWDRVARAKAAGTWQPFVDAGPVRTHLQTLMDAGMGWKRIATVAGMSYGTVSKVLYGRAGQPTKRIRTATASRLLAVRLDLADQSNIDATGSRRRAQALAAIGWSLTCQARRFGRTVTNYSKSLHGDTIHVVTARAIAALYDELWSTAAPAGPGSARARGEARRRKWPSPLAWDDETIDDPAARPQLGAKRDDEVDEEIVKRAAAGERVRLNPAERLAAVTTLTRSGVSAEEIGSRLRLSGRTIVRDRADDRTAA